MANNQLSSFFSTLYDSIHCRFLGINCLLIGAFNLSRGGIGEVNQNSSFFLTPVLKIETWVQNEVLEPQLSDSEGQLWTVTRVERGSLYP